MGAAKQQNGDSVNQIRSRYFSIKRVRWKRCKAIKSYESIDKNQINKTKMHTSTFRTRKRKTKELKKKLKLKKKKKKKKK